MTHLATYQADRALVERLRQLSHIALDMDGTIYTGETLLPSTVPFLNQMQSLGIRYSFVTNNPSKSVDDYLVKLNRMGLSVTPDQLYTSAMATIDFLRRQHPDVQRIFALGTVSMCEEFMAAGFELVADSPHDEPDAVVVGFDMTLQYDRLCRAAWWISRGCTYIATNPDLVCPTDLPTVLIDCGSICAMLETATGRAPDKVLGKPDPDMITGIVNRDSISPEQVAMVGDRLYTDILMAHRSGALGVLVLTGECTREQAAAAAPPPHLILPSLAEFGELLTVVRALDQ